MKQPGRSTLLRIKIFTALFFLLLPYIFVLIFNKEKSVDVYKYDNSRMIIMENGTTDLEKFLIRVLAAYISPESEEECIKAMAVVLRTNIVKAMNWEKSISADSLGFEYFSDEEMEEYFGTESFVEYYRRLEAAVNATQNYVIIDKKAVCIDALFHRISSEYTRDGSALGEEYVYLKPVTAVKDIEAEEYLQLVTYKEEQVVAFLIENGIVVKYNPDGLPLSELIVIEEKSGNYIEKISVCGVTIGGEQFADALGLKSTAFSIEEHEGKLRFLVTGVGHGYGLSIYGANELAKEGRNYKEIIKYYYSDVVLKSVK